MKAFMALFTSVPWVQLVIFLNKFMDFIKREMERRALEAAITKGKEVKELEIRKNEKLVREDLDRPPVVEPGGMLSDDEAFGPNRKTRRN